MIETVSLLSFFFLLWSWCSYKYYLETSYIARDQNILLCRKTKKDVTIAVPILDFSLLCSSVQFSHSVVSDSLRPHELQYARPPCPSPTLRVYSKSCLLNWWCHPTISPSVVSSPPPSIILSIRVFSNESVLRIRWPKYWSFSFSISTSNEYSGLISFVYYGYFYSWNFSGSSVFDCVSDVTMQLCVIVKFSKQLCF